MNEEFSSIKFGVLLDPMLPVHKVFGMTIQLERQLHGNEIIHANVSSVNIVNEDIVVAVNNNTIGNFNNKRRFSHNNGNKSIAKCTYCRMSGYIIEKCYKKHGYPPGWMPWYKCKGKHVHTGVSIVVSVNANQNSVSIRQVGADIGLSNEQF